MTGSLEHNLRHLAGDGVMISIWPTRSGRFQANVSEEGDKSWTCHTDDDPLLALNVALRNRIAGAPSRLRMRNPVPEQIDIEDAIATSIAADDEDLIG